MKRKQLTLFLDEDQSELIEFIRKTFNAKQYQLIKSHLTLCREDEIENLTIVQQNLEHLKIDIFELATDGLKRFSDGKGVLIKIKDEEGLFQKLRAIILQNLDSNPRKHIPHITLMHPRNSTCTDDIFNKIQKIDIPAKIKIAKISLIEQEIGKEWKVLKEYKLKQSK